MCKKCKKIIFWKKFSTKNAKTVETQATKAKKPNILLENIKINNIIIKLEQIGQPNTRQQNIWKINNASSSVHNNKKPIS